MISLFRAPDKNGRDAIALLLSRDAMVVLEDGDPWCAQEIENGRPADLPPGQERRDHE